MIDVLQEFQNNHKDILSRAKLRAYSKTTTLVIECMAFMEISMAIINGDITSILEAESLYEEKLREIAIEYLKDCNNPDGNKNIEDEGVVS